MTYEWTAAAMVVLGVLARDGFRAWLKFQAAKQTSFSRIESLETAVTQHVERSDLAIKLLAEDWRKKFVQMEQANEALRKHIDGQVAGTFAQLPPTGSGFNRRGV